MVVLETARLCRYLWFSTVRVHHTLNQCRHLFVQVSTDKYLHVYRSKEFITIYRSCSHLHCISRQINNSDITRFAVKRFLLSHHGKTIIELFFQTRVTNRNAAREHYSSHCRKFFKSVAHNWVSMLRLSLRRSAFPVSVQSSRNISSCNSISTFVQSKFSLYDRQILFVV